MSDSFLYQDAVQRAREAKAVVLADQHAAAVSLGACPLVIELLQAQSNLASLDAKQGAGRLASSSAHPSGANDAC